MAIIPNRVLPIAAILLMLCASAAAGEIYKCSDAQGKVHYGDRPCGDNASVFVPRAAPQADAGVDQRRRKTERLLDALGEERRQEQQAAEERRMEAEKRRLNCQRARVRLRQFSEASALYHVDEAGNRSVFTDAEREASTQEARAAVAQWCGDS
ncbi:MAG: DUF4124 domain-containing protein [Gammaproteobacteria bacterium]|nr:DUF4124 domain-containing protein [Gammaproteobacteria bacterium]MDH3561052.1 DUF4124 domain-containing protein [Gammaproteobacteria bacterium]